MNPERLRKIRQARSAANDLLDLRGERTSGGRLRVAVTSRAGVEAGASLGEPYALVSVSNPAAPPPTLPEDSQRIAALFLHFHDTKLAPGDPRLRGHVRPIEPEQAEAIAAFARAHEELAFLVHCDHGMSRSPAIAAALAEWLGGEEAGAFFQRALAQPTRARARARRASRVMSDERLRALERRWRESGDEADQEAWLRERARAGDPYRLGPLVTQGGRDRRQPRRAPARRGA